MKNTIQVYSFPLSGHAHRVELLLNLAAIPHTVINLKLAEGEHKQPEFLAINPAGQVPVIQDGDTVVCDSNAILVYLARKYAPNFLPSDIEQEAQVQKFLSLAAGELAYGPAAARLITVFNAPLDINFTKVVAEKYLIKLEQHMEGRDFLVGSNVTIADVALYTYTAHVPEGGIDLKPYPNVCRLLTNIEELPGFKAMPTTRVGLLA